MYNHTITNLVDFWPEVGTSAEVMGATVDHIVLAQWRCLCRPHLSAVWVDRNVGNNEFSIDDQETVILI